MGQIIAALDLGTSKSIAFVARKDYSGKLSVLRTETLYPKDAIRKGKVYNSDETSGVIYDLVRKLNNEPALQVEKVYAGIGGQSLHSQSLNIKKTIQGGTITHQLLESIKQEALQYQPEFDENLGIYSCEYYADGQLTSNPRGTMASVIEARFQLVVGNPCLKRSLETVFGKKEIPVAGYFISPLATAEAVLTAQEKESGCALVEWGKGITYVSVYKNKALKYLVALPLGGLAITRDIRSLNVSEDEAEALKIKYGSAIASLKDSGEVPVNEEQNSSRKIKLKDLNWIIELRVDEILKNVLSQIQESGYSQTLDAGIVITGGGALLQNLPQFIRNQTGKEVRLAKPKVWDKQTETLLTPAESCVVGLTILGEENCGKETVKETPRPANNPNPQSTVKDAPPSTPVPPPTPAGGREKKDGLIKKLLNKGIGIFSDADFENPDDQSKNTDSENSSKNNTNK